jgi:DNA-binding transcriptional MerR regulator
MRYTKAQMAYGASHNRSVDKPLTDKIRQEIFVAHRQGLWPTEIRTLTGVSIKVIKRVIRSMRTHDTEVTHLKSFSHKVVNEIKALQDKDLRPCEIVRMTGYCRSTVWHIMSGNYRTMSEKQPSDFSPTYRGSPDYRANNASAEEVAIGCEEVAIALTEHKEKLRHCTSEKDRRILSDLLTGASHRQVIREYKTSTNHINKLLDTVSTKRPPGSKVKGDKV